MDAAEVEDVGIENIRYEVVFFLFFLLWTLGGGCVFFFFVLLQTRKISLFFFLFSVFIVGSVGEMSHGVSWRGNVRSLRERRAWEYGFVEENTWFKFEYIGRIIIFKFQILNFKFQN